MRHHLRVQLITLPTERDGRRHAFTTGYRPQFRYLGQDNDVLLSVPGDAWIEPGVSAEVWLTFYRPDLQQSRLHVGLSFTLAEGKKNIANGMILEILDDSMINSSHSHDAGSS